MSAAGAFTRSSNSRPWGCLSASVGPWTAIRPRSITTTESHTCSTSGKRWDERIRFTPLLWAKIADELQHLVAPFRVQSIGRFIQEEQIGIVDQRLRELDSLFHARGVGFDVAVASLAQSDVKQHLVSPLHRIHTRQPRQLAAVSDKRHGIHSRNVAVGFRHVADPAADCERGRRDIEAEHAHAPARRREEPEQRFEHRALASTVRPEEADGPPTERRSHVVESDGFSVRDAHCLERDNGFRTRHSDAYTAACHGPFSGQELGAESLNGVK